MDADAELGKNPVSKYQIQTRDGTAELVSRDHQFSGANGDREEFIFPVQLIDHEQNWQPYTRLILTLAVCDDLTYIVYIHICLFVWRCRFFRVFFLYHFRFLFVWRVRRTFFSFRMVFFYLVTTGWIFDISLCENSI